MKVKYTPGPWIVSELSGSGDVSDYYIFIEPNIAVIERKAKGIDKHDIPDARLIASAPDLLEAINALVDAAGQWIHHSEQLRIAHFQARVAIAKATGEQ